MTKKKLTKSDLSQFTGTSIWYRHSLVKHILYTEGVRYLAEAGGAYWLVDEIATSQTIDVVRKETFQVWKLLLMGPHRAQLTCEDGNDNQVYCKQIEFTDFPLDKITLYLTDNVILLPSEY